MARAQINPFQPEPCELVYVSSTMPGFSRIKRGETFQYTDTRGRLIRKRHEIARINKLAIPPAYSDVWICPLPNGHLQATGVDARGRKQYRYHTEWRARMEEDKFESLRQFGLSLPRFRTIVARDLRSAQGAPPTRSHVLAAVAYLLDTTYLRVGNETYATENRSFGLTTLRQRHADVARDKITLRFRGKSGVMHQTTLDDKRILSVVRQCRKLPGQVLFQYCDEKGEPHPITSTEVNEYLKQTTGGNFTAKNFRTWHGSVLALHYIRAATLANEGKRPLLQEVLLAVSKKLGNTPAVCKKSYIHPKILALLAPAQDIDLPAFFNHLDQRVPRRKGLARAELALLALLGSRRRRPAA